MLQSLQGEHGRALAAFAVTLVSAELLSVPLLHQACTAWGCSTTAALGFSASRQQAVKRMQWYEIECALCLLGLHGCCLEVRVINLIGIKLGKRTKCMQGTSLISHCIRKPSFGLAAPFCPQGCGMCPSSKPTFDAGL